MRIFALLVSLVLALPASAQQACSDFELVGFTSTTHLGGTGVLGLTVACQAEFSDSRMCTSVEVMQTVNVPGGLTGNAWVRPVFVPTIDTRTSDASGVESSGSTTPYLTCNGWTGAFQGLTVNSDGGFSKVDCATTPLAVACCAAPPASAMAAIVPITSPVGRMMLVIAMLGVLGIYWARRDVVRAQ